jgi:hypothetical protein
MKLVTIKKKIILNSITLLILLFVIISAIILLINFNSKIDKKIADINGQKNIFEQEIFKLQNQEAEYLRYSELWNILDDRKKQFEEIKSDRINKLINKTAKKYLINSIDAVISVPSKIDNIYFTNLKTVDIVSTIIELNYNSLTDARSLDFINELLSNLSGQYVVTNIDIRKDKSYTVQDFGEISAGKSDGNIKTNIKIHWYPYNEKK